MKCCLPGMVVLMLDTHWIVSVCYSGFWVAYKKYSYWTFHTAPSNPKIIKCFFLPFSPFGCHLHTNSFLDHVNFLIYNLYHSIHLFGLPLRYPSHVYPTLLSTFLIICPYHANLLLHNFSVTGATFKFPILSIHSNLTFASPPYVFHLSLLTPQFILRQFIRSSCKRAILGSHVAPILVYGYSFLHYLLSRRQVLAT